MAVSASRVVAIGAAVGEWGAVAWPAQQRAGDLLALLQQILELCSTLAATGWAGAVAPRGVPQGPRKERPTALGSWAWCAAAEGFPDATVSLGGEAVSAAVVLGMIRAARAEGAAGVALAA